MDKKQITKDLRAKGLIAGTDDFPTLRFMQFEAVNFCNYRCPLCKSIVDDHVVRTKLDLESVRQIMLPLKGILEEVSLYGQRGEPFLNKELEDIVKFLKNELNAYVSTSTNGSILNEKRAEKVIDSGLDKIIYAIDGLSQESYEEYRVGGNLAHVLENLKLLSDQKKKKGAKHPKIIFQLIPMASNEHEIVSVKEFALAHGADRVRIRHSKGVNLDPNFKVRKYADYSAMLEREKRDGPAEQDWFKCPFGLESLYVDPNGDCYTCCYGEGVPELMLGNAFKKPILEIWNESEVLWKIRESFANQKGFHSYCKAVCTNRLCNNKQRVA